MNKKNKTNKNKDKKQIVKNNKGNITYSTSTSKIDLLDIVEMYLCKSVIKL